MTKTLTGPANGEWTHTDGGEHSGGHVCHVCGGRFTTAWRYFVGLVCHATVCDDCAEKALKEVTT